MNDRDTADLGTLARLLEDYTALTRDPKRLQDAAYALRKLLFNINKFGAGDLRGAIEPDGLTDASLLLEVFAFQATERARQAEERKEKL